MLVLLGLLLGAAWYGWATVTSEDEPGESETAVGETDDPCLRRQVFKEGTKVKARTIRVNVYNAGVVSGLAGETLDDLVDNGFRRGAADNAPTGLDAGNVTVLTTTRNSPQARLVAQQFRGQVEVVIGDVPRPGVAVVVGDRFRGVDPDAKKRLVLKKRVRTCTEAGGPQRSGAS
jgi:hypothetical protein